MRALLLALLLVAPREAPKSASYHVGRATVSRDELLARGDVAWAKAQAISWGPASYETRFRALWDDTGLLLRFDATDPSPWHTMTKHDEHLWEEEVVEIFLDLGRSGRDYYELEISPANVVCDLRMISASPWQGEFAFDLAGLMTRAELRKDAVGRTTGWTATAFLPWEGFRPLPSANSLALPPKPGDAWRFNVFRIERPSGPSAPEKDAVEVAWSKPPGQTFHAPEVFRDLVFDR